MSACVGDELIAASARLAEAGIESQLLDAQLLMAHVLNCSRLQIIAHPEHELSCDEQSAYLELIEKRVARHPLAYLIGHREFFGLDISVAPGVLIPRPETELLVEECAKRLAGTQRPVVADIGAGSGAIAIALAASLPESRVYPTEISPDAIKVAEANIEKHQLVDRITLLKGDLVAPIAELGIVFDAIVSNPPYIPSADIDDLEPEVRDYEPRLALDGGPDGLREYRRLLPEAYCLLSETGFAAVEIGFGEAEAVMDIARKAGYSRIEIVNDLAGIERVMVACK